MWSVYLIKHLPSNDIYIGLSSDVKRRLKEPNTNQQYSTRRNSGRWILVYMETYRCKEDAAKRENRLKQHGRAKQELLKRVENSLI